MEKLPLVSGKETIRALEKIGYRVARQRGSHFRLYHNNRTALTIPNHTELGRGLLRKILRDAELAPTEFIELL